MYDRGTAFELSPTAPGTPDLPPERSEVHFRPLGSTPTLQHLTLFTPAFFSPPPPLPRGYWSSYFYIASPPLNLDKARNLDFSASLTNILISLFPLASAQLCCVSARLTRRLVLKLHQPTTLPRAARDVIVTRSLLFDPLLFCTQTYRIVQPGQHSSPTTPGKHSTGLPR